MEGIVYSLSRRQHGNQQASHSDIPPSAEDYLPILVFITEIFVPLLAQIETKMRQKIVVTLLWCVAGALGVSAQNTVESIRKAYQAVHEDMDRMQPDAEGFSAMPPEYFDLNVVQNLPATGPHKEHVRMYYGELEPEEEGNPYPPHYLRFVTARYNFAAREFYEEYLYDDKGQVMFIYAISPDVGENMVPYEMRMWFDGRRLLRFTAKKAEIAEAPEDGNLLKAPFKEVYSGAVIPEMYVEEADRCKERARRFLKMFKGIDDNTYL